MIVRQTALPGVLVIEPRVHRDPRGFFLEVWNQRRYTEAGIPDPFVQINHSRSAAKTLRGLHAQVRHPQAKLVRAIEGEVFDVAVDIRPASPTFRRWVGVTLSAVASNQIFIPRGFAHGFCVLGDAAQVEYACSGFYDQEDEIALAWDDPEIGIQWPIEDPLLSEKDRRAPRLAEVLPRLR